MIPKLYGVYERLTGELQRTAITPVNNQEFYSREIMPTSAKKSFNQ